MLPCEFCEISKNNLLQNTFGGYFSKNNVWNEIFIPLKRERNEKESKGNKQVANAGNV